MLKARSLDTLIFGLSARNLELLQQGRPIEVDLAEMGMKGKVVIFYGETEDACAQQLLQNMTRGMRPDT